MAYEGWTSFRKMKAVKVSVTLVLALVVLKIFHSSLEMTETQELNAGRIYVLHETQSERVSTVGEYISESGKQHYLSGRQRYLYFRYKSGLLFPGDFCEEAEELWRDLRPTAEGSELDIVTIERSGSKYWQRHPETRIEWTDVGVRWFSTRLEFARVGEAEWGRAFSGAACDFPL